MALINRSANAVSGALRAVARKRERYTHDVKVGRHTITADEPETTAARTWVRARSNCWRRRSPRAPR